MRQVTVVLVGALLAGTCVQAAEEVYRWVDEDGVVHYSDQPHPGAERLIIEGAPAPGTRLSPRAGDARGAGQQQPGEPQADEPFSYERLEVSQPASEETLWNIGATLDVTLDLQPSLQPGHRVRVYFDGEARDVSGTQFTLEEVYRGEHNIQAEVVDANGNVMIRSQPTRFYVQQTSVVNPR